MIPKSTPLLLVLNPGSSTLKHAVYDGLARLDAGSIAWCASMHAGELHGENAVAVGPVDYRATLQQIVQLAPRHVDAIAYRVVHGGTEFQSPVAVDDRVLARLETTRGLAPLHQPAAIATMRAGLEALPDALHVACFDTAFHATMPECEKRLPIPLEQHRSGVQRYGFHGLSYESIAHQLNDFSSIAARGRTIVCHLGNGASVCGMVDGRSQTTSMSFTPLDGLIMGTRCGRLDIGVVLHCLRQGMSVDQVEQMVTQESGLLGLSGLTSDMRGIVDAADEDPDCELALDMFCRAVAKEVASAATAIGGIDALVFTAGIGEHSPQVRERVVKSLHWMGGRMHADANAAQATMLHAPDSAFEIMRLETDEQSGLARHAMQLLVARSAPQTEEHP